MIGSLLEFVEFVFVKWQRFFSRQNESRVDSLDGGEDLRLLVGSERICNLALWRSKKVADWKRKQTILKAFGFLVQFNC